jgi:V/A-type H+-transporting ATPase subunit A
VSYSAYVDLVTQWWHENVDKRWREYRDEAMNILLRENELQEIVRLVGTESLSERDKMVLETARMLKDGFLKQNAFDPIDAFSTPQKQFALLKMIMDIHRKAEELIAKGRTVKEIREALGRLYIDIVKAKFTVPNDKLEEIEAIRMKALKALETLESK